MNFDLGISKEMFFEKYFEKNIFLQRNAIQIPDFWGEINALFDRTEARAPFIRIFKNGPVAEHSFIEAFNDIGVSKRKLIKSAVHEYLRNGATVIFNRAEISSSLVRGLCRNVAEFAGMPTLANAYLAFGGDGTFGDHWDTHDVFVVQVVGKKHWKVYEPTFEFPLANQTSKDVKKSRPPQPILDCVLERGDCLYIPRGWWHNALPTDGETFHLTIGLHTPPTIDYISWVARNVLSRHPKMRQSIFHSREHEKLSEMRALIEEQLFSRENLDAFFEALSSEQKPTTGFSIELCRSDKNLPDDLIIKKTGELREQMIEAASSVGTTLIQNSKAILLKLKNRNADTVGSLKINSQISSLEIGDAIKFLVEHELVELRGSFK